MITGNLADCFNPEREVGGSVDEGVLEADYIQFLDRMIAIEAKHDRDWCELLRRRRNALGPHVGKRYCRVYLYSGAAHVAIDVLADDLQVVRVEVWP